MGPGGGGPGPVRWSKPGVPREKHAPAARGARFKTPAADLSERARSHAHNQPAVMTARLIFSSTVLTELTSIPG